MQRRLATREQALTSLVRRMRKRSKLLESGCVLWTGHLTRGYGYISFWNGERGLPLRSHRVAYALSVGLSPDFEGGVVMHTCDNPACVNPAHLVLGTQDENMKDKKAKGRNQFGSKCSYAKLDEDQVRAIRADKRIGKVIGPEYGISHRTVWDIKARRIWKHVA